MRSRSVPLPLPSNAVRLRVFRLASMLGLVPVPVRYSIPLSQPGGPGTLSRGSLRIERAAGPFVAITFDGTSHDCLFTGATSDMLYEMWSGARSLTYGRPNLNDALFLLPAYSADGDALAAPFIVQGGDEFRISIDNLLGNPLRANAVMYVDGYHFRRPDGSQVDAVTSSAIYERFMREGEFFVAGLRWTAPSESKQIVLQNDFAIVQGRFSRSGTTSSLRVRIGPHVLSPNDWAPLSAGGFSFTEIMDLRVVLRAEDRVTVETLTGNDDIGVTLAGVIFR